MEFGDDGFWPKHLGGLGLSAVLLALTLLCLGAGRSGRENPRPEVQPWAPVFGAALDCYEVCDGQVAFVNYTVDGAECQCSNGSCFEW